MNEMCPISLEKINENVARANAALTVALLLIFLFSPLKWLIVFVAADFCIRGFFGATYSPFAQISKNVLAMLNIQPVLVDAAPKIFAARIGFLFSCLLTACWLLDQKTAALIIGMIFTACALLEVAFRFCLACKMYPLVCKIPFFCRDGKAADLEETDQNFKK
ncbi:DUF4395 domain-containing protein [Desulfobulbus sp. F4]|nr:DUF4395 domain-containing protein [Desulfobulbus sp. F3]MCW5200504.1 DUF4395 domain-containing protein [Desulfobulbus sp. F4]